MELILFYDEVEQKLKEFTRETKENTNLIIEARYKQYDEETKSMCVMKVNLVNIEGEVVDEFVCPAGAWVLALEKKFK